MRAFLHSLALFIAATLTGCVEEPAVKDAEKAVTAIEQDELKDTQLSIEQAAEEATKLIEEDARKEIEANSASPDLE